MESIVLELQKEALDDKIDIVNLLRKVFLVSTKLDLIDLKNWAKNELNGYRDRDTIPDYRKVYGILKAYDYNYGWTSVNFKESEIEKIYTETEVFESIAEIQKLKFSNDAELIKNFSASQKNHLKTLFNTADDMALFIPVTKMDKIISIVRNSILDWALKLEQEGVLGDNLELSDTEKERAHITTNHIEIKSFQGVLGNVSNSEITQNLDMRINKNDFGQLADFLAKNEVDAADISSLQAAIEDDGAVVTTKSGLGKQVSGWIGSMVSKSASGSWNVSIAAAGNLLSTAISKYYGV